jgi:hypothetical protein
MADRTEDNWIASRQAAANVVKSLHSASNTFLNNPNIKPDEYWYTYYAALTVYWSVYTIYWDVCRTATTAHHAAKSIGIKQQKISLQKIQLKIIKTGSWVQLC